MAQLNEGITLRAGEYDRRLTFQVRTQTQDTFGGFQDVWVDDFTVWGAFDPKSSELLPVSDKRFALTIVQFRIRDAPGRVIDATKHRIVMIEDAKASPPLISIWDIYPPLRQGRARELQINARQYQ